MPSDIYDYLEKIDRDEEESDEQVCGHVTILCVTVIKIHDNMACSGM